MSSLRGNARVPFTTRISIQGHLFIRIDRTTIVTGRGTVIHLRSLRDSARLFDEYIVLRLDRFFTDRSRAFGRLKR